MSSSTSNSRTDEIKVWLAVLAGVLAIEAGIRLVGPRLSLDTRHIVQIPRLAAAVTKKPGLKVVAIGNSTTREGVVESEIESGLSKRLGQDVELTRLYPDDSYIHEWAYIFRKHFSDPKHAPDVLIVPFTEDWIADIPLLQPERLGHFFCRPADLLDAATNSCPDFSSQARLMVGACAETTVYRERIRKRVLNEVVPGYQKFARHAHHIVKKNRREVSTGGNKVTFTRLQLLLSSAAASKTKVVLIALPLPHAYELPAGCADAIQAGGGVLIDARTAVPVGQEFFRDEVHLNEEGATALTRHLAESLAKYLKSQ